MDQLHKIFAFLLTIFFLGCVDQKKNGDYEMICKNWKCLIVIYAFGVASVSLNQLFLLFLHCHRTVDECSIWDLSISPCAS